MILRPISARKARKNKQEGKGKRKKDKEERRRKRREQEEQGPPYTLRPYLPIARPKRKLLVIFFGGIKGRERI